MPRSARSARGRARSSASSSRGSCWETSWTDLHHPSPTSTNLHSQILYQKRPPIRLLLDHLAGRLAGAVPGFGLDLDQHGGGTRLRRLERGRELERVPRHHPIVVIGGGGPGGPGGGPRVGVVQGGGTVEKRGVC